jgi:DnaJ-class molecular chaperone
MIFMSGQTVPCDWCDGKGYHRSPKDRCHECKSTGKITIPDIILMTPEERDEEGETNDETNKRPTDNPFKI